MAVKNIDVSQWQPVQWIDTDPGPRAFMGERSPYEIEGVTVQANNLVHAVYIWGLTVCDQHDNINTCAHCGQGIRFAVICKDEAGHYHPVGEQCAEYIRAGCDRSEWAERQLLSKIKKGKKSDDYYLSGKIEDLCKWFWDVPREQRPRAVRTSKYQAPGKKYEEWYLTIWGDDAGDVIREYYALQALKPIAEAARAEKEAAAAAQAELDISYAEEQRIKKAGEKIGLRASTKKTEAGYKPVLKDLKNKIVWEAASVHSNRDHNGWKGTAALPVALRELRSRAAVEASAV